jgi:ATP-binding cassette, subfamily F, member 3
VGERWGIVGENGAGKSTLIRTILGLLDPIQGRARIGSNVVPGYFSQDADDLDPAISPLDVLVYDCDLLPADARNLLGRFLLSGDDVYRPIKTLSGGEKNKLSLAKLTTLHPNLLVLDEPTNHLDMASREALAEVLKEYKGTLLLVSHDRWLLEQVATHTLDVRHKGAVKYPGSYAEYRRWLASGKPMPAELAKRSRMQVAVPETPAAMTPREISKEIERVRKLIDEVELEISKAERQLKFVEEDLGAPAGKDVLQLTREHLVISEQLQGKMAVWEEQSRKLERLLAMQGS